MQIIWHGGSTIELKEKKERVLLNPEKDISLKDVQAVIMDRTQEKPRSLTGSMDIDWPGEFDTATFAFRGVESFSKKGSTIAYAFQSPDGNIAWMGDMSEYPSEDFIESLGEVHVLLVPVGDKDVLSAKDAFRLVEALEPLVVIPISYGGKREGLAPFLKEMDVKMPTAQKSYDFKRSALHSENMELVILEQ